VRKTVCPCCKGKKFVEVFDSVWHTEPSAYRYICTHCMGKGEIEVEIDVDDSAGSLHQPA